MERICNADAVGTAFTLDSAHLKIANGAKEVHGGAPWGHKVIATQAGIETCARATGCEINSVHDQLLCLHRGLEFVKDWVGADEDLGACYHGQPHGLVGVSGCDRARVCEAVGIAEHDGIKCGELCCREA